MQSNYKDLIKLFSDREYSGNSINLSNVSHSRIRELEVIGETVENIEGEKGIDNPSVFYDCEKPMISINEQSAEIPYTFRSVGAVADSFNLLTGEYIKKIGCYAITGNEDWSLRATGVNGYIYILGNVVTDYDVHNTSIQALCSHCNFIKSYSYSSILPNVMADNEITLYAHTTATYYNVYICTSACADVEAFKAMLQEQYANGTPVTIYYWLAENVTEQAEVVELKASIPDTSIYLEEVNGLGSVRAVLQVKE